MDESIRDARELANAPDGILDRRDSLVQTALVEKEGRELRLKLLSPLSDEWQSRIDLDRPDELQPPYMQAMMLALLWNDRPARVHVLGLGGGCIPRFLRRLDPALHIDCTEIDPAVVEFARTYFGFREDSRLRVLVQDGREYLAGRTGDEPYDVIFLDAFRGVGFAPLRLSTREFLRACRSQIRPGGVLVANVMLRGGLLQERLATLADVFPCLRVHEGAGALVVFASDASRRTRREQRSAAAALAGRLRLQDNLPRMAVRLRGPGRWLARCGGRMPAVLTDGMPSRDIPVRAELLRGISPDAGCPCGSGERFSACHGAA